MALFIMILLTLIVFALSLYTASVLASTSNSSTFESSSCISYDSSERIISITCKTSTLTDIYNQINDKNIIDKESPDGVWLLNAGIVIEQGAKLVIDRGDTKWLKIFAGETSSNLGDDTNDDTEEEDESVHAITVHGSLNIDSVKITSWDPIVNGYIKFEYDILPGREYEHTGIDAIPRPYIRVEDDATGTTNITNSEIAYLGYECGGGCSGISYYGDHEEDDDDDSGDDDGDVDIVAEGTGAFQQGTSILKDNHIHHNRFGFYSVGMGNMILEDNHVHHNFMYGFDPHTGTHDMIIRNNTVHDHGAMGIICSLDCYNVVIENNKISNSAGSGIMFSRNMTNSIARDNYVSNEEQCIFISQSHNNEVYNNTVNDCRNGIYLKSESSKNSIFDNMIQNVNRSAIKLNDGAADNLVYSNTIVMPPSAEEEAINNEDQDNNTFEDNTVITNSTLYLTS